MTSSWPLWAYFLIIDSYPRLKSALFTVFGHMQTEWWKGLTASNIYETSSHKVNTPSVAILCEIPVAILMMSSVQKDYLESPIVWNFPKACVVCSPHCGCRRPGHLQDRGDEVNSSSPGDAYMRQRIGSVLVQIMACRLFDAMPLSKPKLGYCQLDP